MSDAMTLDRAKIQHIAKLACLTLSPEEADRFASELDSVMKHIHELGTVNTDGVPPTSDVQLAPSEMRADEVHAGLTHDEALSQAPRKTQEGFAVPGFVEG